MQISAPGMKPRTLIGPAGQPVVVTGLPLGKPVAVSVGGEQLGSITPVGRIGDATGLTVTADPADPTAVDLAWGYRPGRAFAGQPTFTVTATVVGEKTPATTATGAGRTAHLTGLDPQARYTFTVTPANTASTGKASTATMATTLAELTGWRPAPKVDSKPAEQPKAATSVAVQESRPAPAPAPRPATRTEWFCPQGSTLDGRECVTTRAYTFSTQTQAYTYSEQTTPYTYHSETRSGGECSYLPNPNSPTGLDIYCPTYTVQVKDAAPAGWSDNGSAYSRTVKDATPTGWTDNGSAWTREVKDAAPAGFTDDGSQWVSRTAASSREVPA